MFVLVLDQFDISFIGSWNSTLVVSVPCTLALVFGSSVCMTCNDTAMMCTQCEMNYEPDASELDFCKACSDYATGAFAGYSFISGGKHPCLSCLLASECPNGSHFLSGNNTQFYGEECVASLTLDSSDCLAGYYFVPSAPVACAPCLLEW